MAVDDYYKTLGVSRGATQEEIKKAYRKLARELHPDRNPTEKASEERLKSVNEAYDIIGDPDKRAKYDRYGTADFEGINMDGFGSIFDQIFRGFGFGGGMGSQRSSRGPPQGESLRLTIPLTFKEAFFGVDKEIAITRKVKCETCAGSGAASGTAPVRCNTCGGRGQVMQTMGGFMRVSQTCPACQGMGQRIETPCTKCKGSGLENSRVTLDFPIPPGVEDGMSQRIRGGGNAGPRGGPSGDLLVVFNVDQDEVFIRRGLHVFLDTDIPFTTAVLGGDIEVQTMWGTSKLKIKKGTRGGTVLRMKEKGVHANNGRKGDQMVRVEINIPSKLTKEQKDALEKLEQEGL
ncbi:MAG: molecular chaperone DnaJ [Candidatus Thorarchaeota archaeon]|nr:molecular chaperone DnaJ [Candidatus Thorarchaeota archaeon]